MKQSRRYTSKKTTCDWHNGREREIDRVFERMSGSEREWYQPEMQLLLNESGTESELLHILRRKLIM